MCLQSFPSRFLLCFLVDYYFINISSSVLASCDLSILLLLLPFSQFSSCLLYFILIIILITFSLSILFPFYFIIPDFRFFCVFHPSYVMICVWVCSSVCVCMWLALPKWIQCRINFLSFTCTRCQRLGVFHAGNRVNVHFFCYYC